MNALVIAAGVTLFLALAFLIVTAVVLPPGSGGLFAVSLIAVLGAFMLVVFAVAASTAT